MIIIWGTRLFGRVDEVPGLFHVATRFFHLWYIPLIPLGSSLILSKEGNSYRGMDISLSGKSVLIAWLRVGLILGTLVLGFVGLVLLAATARGGSIWPGIGVEVLAVICLVGAILAWTTKGLCHASYERAVQLAERAGMSEEGLVLLELFYGRVSEQDAKATIERLQADAAEMRRIQEDSSPLTTGAHDDSRYMPPQHAAAAPPTSPQR